MVSQIHYSDTSNGLHHRSQAQPRQDTLLAPKLTRHCHHVAYQPRNQGKYSTGKPELANVSLHLCNLHGPTLDGLESHCQQTSRLHRWPSSIVFRLFSLFLLICPSNRRLGYYKTHQLLAHKASTIPLSTIYHVSTQHAKYITRARKQDQHTTFLKDPTHCPNTMATVHTTLVKS